LPSDFLLGVPLIPQGESNYYGERFTRLLVEGEADVNTIIGETCNDGSQ